MMTYSELSRCLLLNTYLCKPLTLVTGTAAEFKLSQHVFSFFRIAKLLVAVVYMTKELFCLNSAKHFAYMWWNCFSM